MSSGIALFSLIVRYKSIHFLSLLKVTFEPSLLLLNYLKFFT